MTSVRGGKKIGAEGIFQGKYGVGLTFCIAKV